MGRLHRGAASSEDVALMGLGVVGPGHYKYVAPTELPASPLIDVKEHTRVRLGEHVGLPCEDFSRSAKRT
jgi:hypothetical protein